jgi:hypothetical protein
MLLGLSWIVSDWHLEDNYQKRSAVVAVTDANSQAQT